MIYRIYPIKDTYITNDLRDWSSSRFTGSNVGLSEELSVFKRPGIPGAIGTRGSASLGRILLQFDLSGYSELTASGDIPTASTTFTLRLAHKSHGETSPYGFTLDVHPVFKAHIFLGLTIFLVFPFTRLVHALSAPIWYMQ